jgi:predicted branched-subunit amino acid permease
MTTVHRMHEAAPIAPAREARAGALAMAPLIVGYAPFAVVVGAASAACPSPAAGWAATFLVFGGSAHLAVVDLLSSGAGLVPVVVTGLVIQARLVVYSASLAPRWHGWHGPHRALAAATIIDPTWALAQDRHARPGTDAGVRAWYAGAAAVLACAWGALVTAGFLAGSSLPDSAAWSLVSPLALVALVVPQLRARPAVCAVVAAAAVALVVKPFDLPAGTAVLLAMAAGAVAGRDRP